MTPSYIINGCPVHYNRIPFVLIMNFLSVHIKKKKKKQVYGNDGNESAAMEHDACGKSPRESQNTRWEM